MADANDDEKEETLRLKMQYIVELDRMRRLGFEPSTRADSLEDLRLEYTRLEHARAEAELKENEAELEAKRMIVLRGLTRVVERLDCIDKPLGAGVRFLGSLTTTLAMRHASTQEEKEFLKKGVAAFMLSPET